MRGLGQQSLTWGSSGIEQHESERDGGTVATISTKWFRACESYDVDVAAGEDAVLIPRSPSPLIP